MAFGFIVRNNKLMKVFDLDALQFQLETGFLMFLTLQY
jgi:hypothetical protein